LKLKPKLKVAIQNSRSPGSFNKQDPTTALSEMALLFQSDEMKKYFE